VYMLYTIVYNFVQIHKPDDANLLAELRVSATSDWQ